MRTALLMAFLLGVGLVGLYLTGRQAPTTPSVVRRTVAIHQTPTNVVDNAAETVARSTKPVPLPYPDPTKVRDEVKSNPHATPPSLEAFAKSLGPRLTAALQNEAEANRFIDELSDCALSRRRQDFSVIQALCLRNIHRLVEKFPALAKREHDIQRVADPRITKLAE